MRAEAPTWLQEAVSAFGADCKAKLAGPGDREAAIRSPLESLLRTVGQHLGVPAVFHDEVRDAERCVRPDYGVSVAGAISGYVEVKAPGRPIDPARFSGHDKEQWKRQRDLPNLIYTNGTQWRLYRDGELLGEPVDLSGGDLTEAGSGLVVVVAAEFEALLTDFLRWKPAPITSVGALVRAIAPLTRLLRGEVLDQLTAERRTVQTGGDLYSQPFLGLARDWRALLFPQADDATFADGYAQAVTFALLLARTEGIVLATAPLHQIGAALGNRHSLMGVYVPNAETLRKRWHTLIGESDPDTQSAMFKEGRDATLDITKEPLPGTDTHRTTSSSVRADRTTAPRPVRVGYRSFDRQWTLPDSRLMDMPRSDLWAARVPGQVFVTEQHTHPISAGPGIVVSALIPDFHHFNLRGGRALPYLHPDGSPNIAIGVVNVLISTLGREVTAADLLAYIVGISAHPGYTRTFADELTTPGIRVPLTGDPALWTQAVVLGEQVIWLHSYGEVFTSSDRPQGNVKITDCPER